VDALVHSTSMCIEVCHNILQNNFGGATHTYKCTSASRSKVHCDRVVCVYEIEFLFQLFCVWWFTHIKVGLLPIPLWVSHYSKLPNYPITILPLLHLICVCFNFFQNIPNLFFIYLYNNYASLVKNRPTKLIITP